jgi:hypothetical protein
MIEMYLGSLSQQQQIGMELKVIDKASQPLRLSLDLSSQ